MSNALRNTLLTGCLQRYVLGELGGKLGVLAAVYLPALAVGAVLSAPLIALCELGGFYGCILLRDLRGVGGLALLPALRRLAAQFGPAELLDALVIRPGMIALVMGSPLGAQTGAIAGSVASDAIFYAFVTLTATVLRLRRQPRV
jgi:hypothetical protein